MESHLFTFPASFFGICKSDFTCRSFWQPQKWHGGQSGWLFWGNPRLVVAIVWVCRQCDLQAKEACGVWGVALMPAFSLLLQYKSFDSACLWCPCISAKLCYANESLISESYFKENHKLEFCASLFAFLSLWPLSVTPPYGNLKSKNLFHLVLVPDKLSIWVSQCKVRSPKALPQLSGFGPHVPCWSTLDLTPGSSSAF